MNLVSYYIIQTDESNFYDYDFAPYQLWMLLLIPPPLAPDVEHLIVLSTVSPLVLDDSDNTKAEVRLEI